MGNQCCCFTGHRPQKLPFRFNEDDERCKKLKKALFSEIEMMITKYNVTLFISGMAIGVDMYAAEAVLQMKKHYPNILLEAAVPCENQAVKWNTQLRNRYDDIINRCDIKTILQTDYSNDCMQKRNRYMVDKSEWVIAVWDGTPSGTGKTVKYAEGRGVNIVRINPKNISE